MSQYFRCALLPWPSAYFPCLYAPRLLTVGYNGIPDYPNSAVTLLKVSNTPKVLPGGHTDNELPIYGDELPEADTTSLAMEQQIDETSEVIESVSSVVAPMRRKKKTAKTLPKDRKLELSNTELLAWNTDYVKNMKAAARSEIQKRTQRQAKKNAEYYVWGVGIGGLGRDQFASRGPLAGFLGDNLFELFTGTSRNCKATSKRDRDSGIDEATQGEARPKRQKMIEYEEEIGRGHGDEGLSMPGGDEEVEFPREAVSALDDQQIFSAMPWNISASKRGSSALPLSGRVTTMSEQGRQGSRAASRMVSASPLLRRSTGRFEALQSLDSDAVGGDDFAFAAPTSDPAVPEEVVMEASLRVHEALSTESGNFFAFVAEAITNKINIASDPPEDPSERLPRDQTKGVENDEITFEDLLPPPETSKMIACQGFLMLLSLGTKDMLSLQQPTAFEHIMVKLNKKAKAMQTVEVEDGGQVELEGDEDMEDVTPGPEEGHFQEQMAAAAGHDDEHESLHDSH